MPDEVVGQLPGAPFRMPPHAPRSTGTTRGAHRRHELHAADRPPTADPAAGRRRRAAGVPRLPVRRPLRRRPGRRDGPGAPAQAQAAVVLAGAGVRRPLPRPHGRLPLRPRVVDPGPGLHRSGHPHLPVGGALAGRGVRLPGRLHPGPPVPHRRHHRLPRRGGARQRAPTGGDGVPGRRLPGGDGVRRRHPGRRRGGGGRPGGADDPAGELRRRDRGGRGHDPDAVPRLRPAPAERGALRQTAAALRRGSPCSA